MNRNRKKLNNLYNITNSVFTDLQAFDVPWKSKNINQKLDIMYMTNQSGNKFISPLVENFIDDNGEVSAQDRATIASVIFALYNDNWSKLYATLSFEYDPIENYSMVEQMTNDQTVTQYGRTNTRTDNLSHTRTGTDATGYQSAETRTDDLTHAKSGSETVTYNVTDQRTDNLTETRTDDLKHTKEGSEMLSKNETETRTDNLEHSFKGGESRTPATTTQNQIYAFNSTTPSPTSQSSNTGVETTQYQDRRDTETGTVTTQRDGRDITEFNNVTEKNTGTETSAKTGTETNAKTGTETTSFTNRSDTDTGTQTTAHSGMDTVYHNTTDADTGTQTDAQTGSDTATRNYRLTRSGNIGVTTSQQMIESERNLWLWNFFYKVVFPDVDRALTLNIY